MKSKIAIVALLAAFTVSPTNSARAQGALAPSGAPAPTMKTLQQIEPRTPISSLPYIITNAGSYYLTGNLTGIPGTNGIIVLTNNVTIDLNGFTLSGVVGSGDGINVGNDGDLGSFATTNFTVINGVVQRWGRHGIHAGETYSGRFEQLQVTANVNYGIVAGKNSIVLRCAAQSNGGTGIGTDGPRTLLDSCVAFANGWDGIRLGNGSRAVNCISGQNSQSGFLAFTESTVLNSTAQNNGNSGIALGINSVALHNTCTGNNQDNIASEAGISAFYGGGRIEGNHITYSIGVGILVSDGKTRVTVVRNTTVGTTTNAFSIPPGNDVGPWGQAATATSPLANIRN